MDVLLIFKDYKMKNIRQIKQILLVAIIVLSRTSVVLSQDLNGLVTEEQKSFFEGYWKYTSTTRDTIFIVKLKYFEMAFGGDIFNYYIGSYLYKTPSLEEDNLPVLTDYMQESTYDDYYNKYSTRIVRDNYIPIRVCSYSYNDMVGVFYDYTKDHMNGVVTLSVISIGAGAETISWSLKIGEGVYMYTEGEQNRLFSFSVPTTLVLTKVHNLSEFEDLGIFLPPFPQKHEIELGDPH